MASLRSLPKVVKVGALWNGGTPDSTVEENELLIVKGWKRKISGKLLKVYNPNTKENKNLSENCQGSYCPKNPCSNPPRLF